MANSAKAGGLRLIDAVNGAGAGMEVVIVPSADTAPTGIGDPVQQTAGNYTSIGGGPNVNKVQQASATSAVYGVVMSALPQYTDGTGQLNLNQVYRTASTNEYMLVRVANNQDVYEITDDAATPGLTSGHLNYNYKFVVANCSTATGMSNFLIDSANGANTATYPIKVIAPSTAPNNDPTLASASWRVNLNNVVRSGGTGTAGV